MSTELVVANRQLFLREGGCLVPLLTAKLMALEACDKHIVLHMATRKKHSLAMPMHKLMAVLALGSLQQVHRSWVVNLRFIKAINPQEGTIQLGKKVVACLGQKYRRDLLERLHVLS